MLDSDSRLSGVYAILPTPYARDGSVDGPATTQIAKHVESGGVHALTALGNTSEVQRLDPDERRLVLESVVAGAKSSMLIVGLEGSSSEMAELAGVAGDLGYDAAMIHEPSDPLLGDQGYLRYFRDIVSALSLPVIPYLRDGRIPPEIVNEISSWPEVLAVKVARPDSTRIVPSIHGRAVPVFGGAEGGLRAAHASGFVSFTSGIANSHPEVSLRIWEQLNSADTDGLLKSLAAVEPFEEIRRSDRGRFNVAAVKAACQEVDLPMGMEVRPPHESLDAVTLQRVLTIVRSWEEAG